SPCLGRRRRNRVRRPTAKEIRNRGSSPRKSAARRAPVRGGLQLSGSAFASASAVAFRRAVFAFVAVFGLDFVEVFAFALGAASVAGGRQLSGAAFASASAGAFRRAVFAFVAVFGLDFVEVFAVAVGAAAPFALPFAAVFLPLPFSACAARSATAWSRVTASA